MYAIFTDETAVEFVKKTGPYRQQRPKWLLLTEVFGKGQALFLVTLHATNYTDYWLYRNVLPGNFWNDENFHIILALKVASLDLVFW